MITIPIVYADGMMDVVDPKSLQILIEEHAIIKFRRHDGWVCLGIDPVRKQRRDNYLGPERRMSS